MTHPNNDSLFDAFLEDGLVGQQPPDLREEIAFRLRNELPNDQQLAEWGEAVRHADAMIAGLAIEEGESIADENLANRAQAYVTLRPKSDSGATSRRSREQVVALASVALTLFVAGAIGIVLRFSDSKRQALLAQSDRMTESERSENAETDGGLDSLSAREDGDQEFNTRVTIDTPPSVESSADAVLEAKGAETGPSKSLRRDMLSLPDGDQRRESSPRQATMRDDRPRVAIENSILVPGWKQSEFNDNDILRIIDDQLVHAWREDGYLEDELEASQVDRREWFVRASQSLLGRGPTAEELAWLVETQDGDLELVRRLTRSSEFSKVWSRKLARAWWTRADVRNDAGFNQFAGWLAQQLVDRQPMYVTQQEVVFGIGKPEDATGGTGNPATFWVTSSHPNAQRFADNFADRMLGENLTCNRCHASKDQVLSPLEGGDQQLAYWQWVAATTAISLDWENDGEDGGQIRVVEATPEMQFFEQSNGKMVAASSKIPFRSLKNGDTGLNAASSRSDLQRWFVHEPRRPSRLVDIVWTELFGSSLSRQSESLRELQKFLSQQFASNGEQLEELIAWSMASKAAKRPTPLLDASRVVRLSRAELRQWRAGFDSFAVYVPGRSIENTLQNPRRIARNLAQRSDGELEILAQPAMANAEDRKGSYHELFDSKKGQEYLLFQTLSEQFPKELEMQMSQWSQKLSWDQQVDHLIWYTSNERSANAIREIANSFRKSGRNNDRLALQHLATCLIRTNAPWAELESNAASQ